MEKWFFELQEPGVKLGIEYEDKLLEVQTKYQKLEIYKTKRLGNLMVLDGCVMTTDEDEFFYHEMISHPSLYTHPNPEKVLIIGGGDGGTLREVLKHPVVKEAHLCEIDGEVIEAAKKYFPNLSISFKDPRTSIFVEDGFAFLDRQKEYYDVILVDSTDPVGEAAKLYEESFFKKIYNSLKSDGIFTIQAENYFYELSVMKSLYNNVKSIFNKAYFYFSPVITYPSGNWSFLMGTKKYHPIKDSDFNKYQIKTKYYNRNIHYASFALPEIVKGIVK
ncbi:MAG TPA: polyamine aminopropyltransferase [Spirochaetota bacterium]|nr:polyamine aminopropyltransferase [Spirochaetota bacterium]HOM38958.1 polyamine aminopropyltransferase [Spirochaetota bacterium]HPQ49216.1 polyamine aminopropyltransferase [Spirochaetota bacterium]